MSSKTITFSFSNRREKFPRLNAICLVTAWGCVPAEYVPATERFLGGSWKYDVYVQEVDLPSELNLETFCNQHLVAPFVKESELQDEPPCYEQVATATSIQSVLVLEDDECGNQCVKKTTVESLSDILGNV